MVGRETVFSVMLESDDRDVLKNLTKPELVAYFNRLTEQHGEAFARVAMKRMSDMLKPGHRYNVGASGGASENFDVEQSKRGPMSEYVVVTKGKTKANYFIRMGYKGNLSKFFGFGKLPPEAPIKKWIADKGIMLRSGREGTVTTRVIHSKSKYGKPYTRSLKHKNIADLALMLIRFHIAGFGSTMNHWTNLFPTGQGRFDYAAYTVKQRGYFDRLLTATGDQMISAVIDYINTGSMTYTGRIFRQYE